MREMAADFMLLPHVEQDRALAHPQAARYFLTSAVHTLREDCVFHFNRHLPEEWDESSRARASHWAIMAARGGTSGPDEELLRHIVNYQFAESDVREGTHP